MRGNREMNETLLSIENTVADMLAQPDLAPFAAHLLPRSEDARLDLALADIAGLMPWHTEIRPQIIVESLNRLIRDIRGGGKVFYSFGGEAHTGLFFMASKPDAPFALVCPGGGFRYIGLLHEGLPLAQVISEKGFNAFALQYRAGGERIACKDMAQALGWIFGNAAALRVSTEKYSVWGGSAGARMAADLGTYGSYALGGPELPPPCAVIMAYTSHGWHVPTDPPTFAIAGENDEIAPAYVMARRIAAMKDDGIEAQIRVFPGIGHGFGTGAGTPAEGWVNEAITFWEKQIAKN